MTAQNPDLTKLPLVVYGLGASGQKMVDELLDAGIPVDFILDRGKAGQEYRGIDVRALGGGEADLSGRQVFIALHNHYVDVNRLHSDLIAAGAERVLTPIQLPELCSEAQSGQGYWLDRSFDYQAHEQDFERLRTLLADEKSRDLLDDILRYRRSGDLADCPVPSLEDEYVPVDLPRYAEPVRLIDCGAFTGVAIHKFLKANYDIETFVAFEPDQGNFAKLAGRNFPVKRGVCLPLGTWSSTTQLSFSSDSSMGSCVSDEGNVTIQCVAIDDVLHGEPINLVKLDVEGAEIETLLGMEKMIRSQRPNLLVSVYHTPGHLFEIADMIHAMDLGYRFHLRVHEYNTFGIVLYCLRDELLQES